MLPHRLRPRPWRVAGVTLCVAIARSAGGQHAGHEGMTMPPDDGGPTMHVMAQAIPLVTRVDATPGAGGPRTELALTQTLVMARAAWWQRHATLDATVDAEGLTMPGGELSLGAFGEGFVDRRHPHTYLHELVVSGIARPGPLVLSLSAGRGFAPFGTDDPMVRPFAKYPINHHLAQILERGLLIGAARLGPAIVETATFTGEEPQHPSSLPLPRRFGDSWSVRGTLLPLPAADVQASYARLASPELPGGFGLDQRKQSISARYAAAPAGPYALIEWARTVEYDHSRRDEAFAYESALAEAAAPLGAFGVAVRLEQTNRPEEERLADPFRTARPATDLHIAGITRWRTATLGVATPAVTWSLVRGVPFVELSRLAATSTDARTLLDPELVYGRTDFWMLTAGVRLAVGAAHGRMGRYGAAIP